MESLGNDGLRKRPTTGTVTRVTRIPQGQETTTISREQRIRRELVAQEREERAQRHELKRAYNSSMKDLFISYLKVMAFVLSIGGGLLFYLRPKLIFGQRLERLSDRHWVVLYPTATERAYGPVKSTLPRFYMNFAIAIDPDEADADAINSNTTSTRKKSNLHARHALQHVHSLRMSSVKLPNKIDFTQRVSLHLWEHEDFKRQLETKSLSRIAGTGATTNHDSTNDNNKKNDHEVVEELRSKIHKMDAACGDGFYDRYNHPLSLDIYKDHLLLYCLLLHGSHDGIIDYNLQAIDHGLTKGTRGLAFQYYDTKDAVGEADDADQKRLPRISSSILLLPILPKQHLEQQAKAQRTQQRNQQSKDAQEPGTIRQSQSQEPKEKPKPVEPSTRLPVLVMEWLLQTSKGMHYSSDSYESMDQLEPPTVTREVATQHYIQVFEEQLYEIIMAEQRGSQNDNNDNSSPPWVILKAACSFQERIDSMNLERRMATTCQNDLDPHEDECCAFYDPNLRPVKSRQQVEEEMEME